MNNLKNTNEKKNIFIIIANVNYRGLIIVSWLFVRYDTLMALRNKSLKWDSFQGDLKFCSLIL